MATIASIGSRLDVPDRDARVPARGTGELAELAGAFNEMAASLKCAEQIRSQLVADVAHELCTPLATVESYVEALADGVLESGSPRCSPTGSTRPAHGRAVGLASASPSSVRLSKPTAAPSPPPAPGTGSGTTVTLLLPIDRRPA